MSIKQALLATSVFALAAVGAAVEVQFYDENLPSSLNPLYAESMVDYRAQELYFDRLYYNDPITNELVSRIVSKWEIASPTSVRLYVKPGLKWHNGQDLTADDICFTIQAMLDKGTTSKNARIFREFFQGCTVEKNLVAKVEYTKVFYKPIAKLNFAVLPQSVFGKTAIKPNDKQFSIRPTGSGPMSGGKGAKAATFKAHRISAHHKPQIDKMKMSQAADPIVQVNTVRNGRMHGIISVAPQYRPELSASSEVSLKTYDLRSWWFIAINTKNPALASKEVRQALNYLIDRNDLREKTIGVRRGDKESPCEFISGPFVQSSPYYNRTVRVVEARNRSRATSLLKRAGLEKIGGNWHHNNKPIMLRIGMKDTLNKEAPDLLPQIGNQLGQAGFKRQVYKIGADEWSSKVVTGRKANDYDLLIGKWSFNIDEDVNDLFKTRTKYEGTRNIFNYSNAKVDQILNNFNKARSVDAAKDAYHQLHATLADELPYLFLWKLDTKSAWRKEIRSNIISPYYYFTVIDDWKYAKR